MGCAPHETCPRDSMHYATSLQLADCSIPDLNSEVSCIAFIHSASYVYDLWPYLHLHLCYPKKIKLRSSPFLELPRCVLVSHIVSQS
jgi:hypothetical protein